LWQVLVHPRATFSACPEPVNHGRALRYLATLRLPAWVVLITWLGIQYATAQGPDPTPMRSIHVVLQPPVAEVLSVWLVLLVPVGMPLLYFLGGLIAHIGIALTGGASRSIGASMRAVGYALSPALLGIALLDLPLYTVGISGWVYASVAAGVVLLFWWTAGFALSRTHQTHPARGFLVSLIPAGFLIAATVGRASLVLDEVPLIPPPEQPYWIP
jgi:hypothetical protein